MNKVPDITGQRFGHLVAIKRVRQGESAYVIWLFKCDCGKTKEIARYDVYRGRIKSCGCVSHYVPPLKKQPGFDRVKHFWSLVDKAEDGCWYWTGTKNNQGYGRMSFNGKTEPAHRISYRLTIGDVPSGMFVCHRCDNPSCVNPSHLFIGSHKDNMADMRTKGRSASGESHGCFTQPWTRTYGTRNSHAVLSESDVIRIRSLYKQGGSPSKLSESFGVGVSQIKKIVRGESWKHLPFDGTAPRAISQKLNPEQVTAIRDRFKTGYPIALLVEEYSVSRSQIYRIVNRCQWKDLD